MEKKILPRKIINITKIIIFVYILQLLLSLILYYRSIEKYEIDEIKISIFLDIGDIFLDNHVNIRFYYQGWTYVAYSDSQEYINWKNGLEVKTTNDFIFLYEKGECDQPIIGMPRRGMRILPL